MHYLKPRKLDFISDKLRVVLKEAEGMSKKRGVIISYEQFSIIIDHMILHESLIAELYCHFIEQEIVIVNLGANFLILDAKEIGKYKRLTTAMLEEVM